MSAESAIRAESLTKSYRSGGTTVAVLNDLSLQIGRGERVAIMGESGAGKSTLLHLLGGLDRASGGQIFFGRRDIASLSDRELADFRNQEIGFVWQNSSLLPEFNALENVMMPLLVGGATFSSAKTRARAMLAEVGLSARENHLSGELSGGEQQRVALARALAVQPSVLLADEPTGSLDHRTGDMISDLLDELHVAHRLTSVFVTHNFSFAQRCNRVLELRKGSLHPPSVLGNQEARVGQDATRLDGGTYV